MKKLVMLLTALALTVAFSASQTGAAFLPDVKFDNNGRLIYNSSSHLLELYNSVDERITLPGGSVVTLTDEFDYDPVVGFGLAIYVDDSGNFIGGVSGYRYSWTFPDTTYTYTYDYDMVEVLLRGTITVANSTYDASGGPVLLLGADVDKFGWLNYYVPSPGPGWQSIVSFQFSTVEGAWVADGIWPTTYPTVAFATINGKLDWTTNFDLENKGGDKYPTPEPSSLLLLGSGLLGFGVYFRARFGRKR